jgi:hypothetical protein
MAQQTEENRTKMEVTGSFEMLVSIRKCGITFQKTALSNLIMNYP